MKADWWLGILWGMLFGLVVGVYVVPIYFELSRDARSLIAAVGIPGMVTVDLLRRWINRKNQPTSTQR